MGNLHYLRKGCDILDESTKRKPKKNMKKYHDYCYACKLWMLGMLKQRIFVL